MSNVVIVTDTLYKDFNDCSSADFLRGQLALESARKAKEAGFPMVVVDGGSALSFCEALKEAGAHVYSQFGKSMSAGRRQGYQIAFNQFGANVVVRMEPEKHPLIETNWIERAAHRIMMGESHIFVPSRTPAGYNSLPPIQAELERQGNESYCRMLRECDLLEPEVDLDVFFGPRVFGREVYHLFLRTHVVTLKTDSEEKPPGILRPNMYSEALYFPLVYALYLGKRVYDMQVDYIHPAVQTAFETGKEQYDQKRRMQQETILAEHREILELIHGRSSFLKRSSNQRMYA